MADHPDDRRSRGKRGGAIEMKPQWGAEPDSKPEPVAVRRPGDAGELFRRSAADLEDMDVMEQASAEVRKQRWLAVGIFALVLLGGIAAAVMYMGRTVHSLQVTPTYLFHNRTVALDVAATMNRPGVVAVGDDVEQLTPGEDQRMSFVLPMDSLELGENVRTVKLTKGEGELVEQKDIKVYRDFDLKEDFSTLVAPAYEATFRFTIPTGWTLRAQGKDLTSQDQVLPFPLKKLFESIDAQPSSPFRFELPIKIVRPGGEQLEYVKRVEVPLPTTKLELEAPTGKLTVTADAQAHFKGATEPGAKLLVGGSEARVTGEGRFEVKVELGKATDELKIPDGATREQARQLAEELAKKQGVEIEVMVDAEQKVATFEHFDFLRVTPGAYRRYRAAVD